MWVARNHDNKLYLFEEKPDRCDHIGGKFPGDKLISITACVWLIKNPYGGFYDTWGNVEIEPTLFPDLTWDDEPIEVKLIEDSKKIVKISQETTDLDRLIKKFEILNTQFQGSEESIGHTFEEYAKKHWNNVDMNYFDYIM